MSEGIAFESVRLKSQKRQEKREAREKLIEKAKSEYEKEERKKEQAKLKGEGTWMLPSLSDRIDRESKSLQKSKSKKHKKEKKKKHKKEKKKKKSKTESSSDSDSEDSGDESLWVEKSSEKKKDDSSVVGIVKGPQLQREEWMQAPTDLFPTISRKEIREQRQKEKDEADSKDKTNQLDKLGQHERELNPYWKDGGVGLPEENKKHKPHSSFATVGDGGYSWMKKAYDRCVEQAKEENRSLEDVATEKYGSFKKLQKMLADAEKAYKKIQSEKNHNQSSGERYRDERSRHRGFAKPSVDDDSSYNRRPRFMKPQDDDESRSFSKRGAKRSKSRSRSRERSRRKSRSRSKSTDRRRSGSQERKKVDLLKYRRRSRSTERRRSRSKERRRSRSKERRRSRSTERRRSRSKERRSRSLSKDRFEKGKYSNSATRRFMKPGDSEAFSSYGDLKSKAWNSPRQSGWKKKEFIKNDEKKEENLDHARKSRKPSTSSENESSESSSSDSEDDENQNQNASGEEEEIVLLSEQEMNQLGAKIVRAEIMGDNDLATKLKEQLEKARENKEKHKNDITTVSEKEKAQNRENTVVLTRTDRRGVVRPLSESQHEKQGGKKRRKTKVATHSGKERERYFDDDDKFSLRQLVEREKTGTAEDQNMMFSRLAGRSVEKTDDDFQVDDMFVSKAARKQSEAQQEEKERSMAIFEHRKMAASMEKCQFCFDNCPKHLIIAIGVKVYLCLPNHRSLTEGHCLIVPMQHVASGTVVDEDVWNEIQMFRRGLVKMFEGMDQDIVFMETCMGLKSFPHMHLECIPMPKETGDLAPIYFKKAIQDAGPEWAQNKKLVDLSGRDVRRAVPKGFPYFAVDFGMQSGYAHVIEDERTFQRYFGREVVGGMVEAEPQLWRKPHRENFDDQRKKVLQFSDWWKPFDWTNNINKEES